MAQQIIREREKRQDIHTKGIPVVCVACEARHKGVCGALSPEQLTYLSSHTTKHVYTSQEELISAGEDATQYANILSGVVKLTKLLADGRQQIVGLQFAPDFLGRPFKRSNDTAAEAATDVRVCAFPRTVLEELIETAPGLEHRLHEQALDELDEARDWLLALGRKNASEKVSAFLYMIACNIDPEALSESSNRVIEFELPLKRAEIADFLGLTIETVSRQITKLRKAHIIELINNRTVRVISLNGLRASAEQET